HRDRECAAGALRSFELVLAAAVPNVHRLLRLGAGRNEQTAIRFARGGIGACSRLHGRILIDPLPAVHAWRVCIHRRHVRADHDPVSWWLAATSRHCSLELGTWDYLVPA